MYFNLTTAGMAGRIVLRMPRARRPAPEDQVRLHFLPEWADKRGMSQADLGRETGADKGTVSRWFAGQLPSEHYLIGLAKVLGLDEPSDLFRHPDDDWLAKFFRDRDSEEIQRIKQTLEAAFPKKVA